MENEKVYLVTDGCMWEANKRNGTAHAHAIEVVDTETGAVQYITNKATSEVVPRNKQSMPKGKRSKTKSSRKDDPLRANKSL